MQVEDERGSTSEKIEYYLRQNNRGTQIFLYGVAGFGLLVAIRRIRPFSRFSKPSDIPDHFIKSKVRIGGNVIRIEPSGGGPLLMVQTKPLVPVPRIGRIKQLPIKIADVDVTANGTSWLQNVISGRKIVFVPLAKGKDSVECRISMVEPNTEVKLDIGKELVRLGFGMVHAIDKNAKLSKDKEVSTYRKSLVETQKWAERQRNGYWHYAIQPTLLWKLKNSLSIKVKSVVPGFVARLINI